MAEYNPRGDGGNKRASPRVVHENLDTSYVNVASPANSSCPVAAGKARFTPLSSRHIWNGLRVSGFYE
jgi:hypothetical protein